MTDSTPSAVSWLLSFLMYRHIAEIARRLRRKDIAALHSG
jgi:hypothetical protein